MFLMQNCKGELRLRPVQQLCLLIFFQVFLWTLIPYLSNQTLPLDVIREGLSWGQEWQAGYHKHPPFVSWICNVFYEAFGDLGPYFLSQASIGLTYYYSFRTSKYYLSEQHSFLATIMLLGVYYFSWPSPEFNHNVAQMPVWAALIFLFHRVIFSDDRKAWILIGAVIGLGALIKYSIFILPFLMLVYLFVSHKLALTFRTPEVYVGALLALLIISPHAFWLYENNFITFGYLSDRANGSGDKNIYIGGIKFLLAQFADHLPMMIGLAITGLLKFQYWSVPKNGFQKIKVLALFAVGPALLTVLISFLSGMGLRDMWGAPMWSLSGTLVMVFISKDIDDGHFRKILSYFLSLFLIVVCLYGVSNKYGSLVTGKLKRTDWPATKIAAKFNNDWVNKTGCPLRIVAGENWLAGLVSAKVIGRPSVWIDADFQLAPWVTKERLKSEGALLLWLSDDVDEHRLLERAIQFGPINIEEPKYFDWPGSHKNKTIKINWAYISPQNCGSK